MSDRWVPVPVQIPRQCFRLKVSQPEHGPYFEFERAIYNGETGRFETQYLSRTFLDEMLQRPGSPFAAIPAEDYNATCEALRIAEERVEFLEGECAELFAEAEELRDQVRSAPAVDVEELADALTDVQNKRRMAKARAGRGGSA